MHYLARKCAKGYELLARIEWTGGDMQIHDTISSDDVYTGIRTMGYITTEDAAGILSVSIRRVQAMIRTGLLPAKRFGKAYMLLETDVRWLNEQERVPGWRANVVPPSQRN